MICDIIVTLKGSMQSNQRVLRHTKEVTDVWILKVKCIR